MLSRPARLTGEENAIGVSADSSARVSIPGKDDLSQLGSEINTILCALEKSQVEGIGDTYQAPKSVESNDYNLLLLDMKMPGMTGRDFLLRFPPADQG
jgi:CheY-like chemotaxis protein